MVHSCLCDLYLPYISAGTLYPDLLLRSLEFLIGIQAALDAVVAADIPVFSFTIARGKAEEKYGDTMYDRFEVPSHVS